VVSNFRTNVEKKLSAYRDKRVRVVVDLTDNEVLHRSYDVETLRTELQATLRNLREIGRLTQVDAILPGRPPLMVYQSSPSDSTEPAGDT